MNTVRSASGYTVRRRPAVVQRRTRMTVLGGALIAFACIAGCVPPSQPVPTDAKTLTLQRIASGFVAPVSLVAPNDSSGRLFIVDQAGIIWVYTTESGISSVPLLDLRDDVDAPAPGSDERGLLGLALHPSFASNGKLYVYFNTPPSAEAPSGSATEVRLSEFRINATQPDVADAGTERILFRIAKPAVNHNGGQLAFGPDGFLYIGIGDGGGAGDVGTGHTVLLGNAQDTSNLFGKILRIDVDSGSPYGIPATNPFATSATSRREIYAYGLRNPWRFSFDVAGGVTRLFAGDVGQSLMEEVDLIERGGNYGWNRKEGTLCFNPAAPGIPLPSCSNIAFDGSTMRDPILTYAHTDANGAAIGTAVIGGYVYRGAAIANLSGQYVFGDLSAGGSSSGKVFVASAAADGTWSLEEVAIAGGVNGRLGRFVLAFGQDAAGELYVLSRASTAASGAVDKIVGFE